jgi:hypothetical protein
MTAHLSQYVRSRGWLLLAIIAALFSTANTAAAQATFVEGFDNVGPTKSAQVGPQNLINRGWIFRNQSSPIGQQSWHDGYLPDANPIWPSPQAGAGYMAVDGNSTDFFGGRVSNWSILPTIPGQRAGDVLRFYAINLPSHNMPSLQIRYSPSGNFSTGSGADTVGDFTTLLFDINPLPVGGWNLYSVTLPGSGRIALRYYIAQECNFGCASAYTGIDSMSIGSAPAPPCNLPPVPAAGQTVTWRFADSPYRVCQNIGIPPGATVNVEPGVRIDFDSGKQLVVNGTLNLQGTGVARITFSGTAVFPPIIDVINGTISASFADFGGQFLVESGATISLADCRFSGFGLLRSQELPAVVPYVKLDRCVFTSSQFTMSDALVVLRNNTFTDTYAEVLRGYADVTAPNSFTGQPFRITRETGIQPFYFDNVSAIGVPGSGGLILTGSKFLLGPGNILQNNRYPIELEGGLMPGTNLQLTGNLNNAIDVHDGGFRSDGRWINIGIPYRLTALAGSLPGGYLTIDPGVTVEGDPGTSLVFRSTRRLIAKGLPNAPITFRSTALGQTWHGLTFQTNSTEGPRLEYCTIRDAEFGTLSSDNLLYVDNCSYQNNQTGANANSFGSIIFGKTRFLNNATGASVTDQGNLGLMNATAPNAFTGNTAGINTLGIQVNSDARKVWWGSPTGPNAPQNPGGLGDSITGPGAAGISIFPFLTASPDFNNTPPVVRLTEPGFIWSGHSRPVDYFVDQGTKYIIRWTAQDNDAIVKQKILFSPDGHYPDRFIVIADNLPGNARSFEWTVANPGFAVTNQPQFLRVVATDATGQEGWDQTPLIVSSGRLQGELTITTNLTGQTFYAGQPIPAVDWTGVVSDFPTYEPFIVLESDGEMIGGTRVADGHGEFFGDFPAISTDTARIAIRASNNSNDVKWFFASGYFSIRHDPRLNFVPPVVQMLTPDTGATFAAGSILPITWSASDDEGLYSFDVQVSYDGARTWHILAKDLASSTRSYNWELPSTVGISGVRVRVIARDIRFQNNSSGSDRSFTIGTGAPPPQAVSLVSVTLNPASMRSGNTSQGTVTLSGPAPAGGAVITLQSSNTALASMPSSVTVPAGTTSTSFIVSTIPIETTTTINITATFNGVSRSAALTLTAVPGADSVTIDRAEYLAVKSLLQVDASSSGAGAVLTAYVTSTNALIGRLTSIGGGKFRGKFTLPASPQNITVRSSYGGSATRAVIVK